MLGGLALGFIWQFIFQIVFSQILFGPESLLPIPFLQNMTQDNTKALFALAILVTWQMAGYMMIIYITGLNNIPYDLYEAAEIDGASTFQRFRVITLPMLMPVSYTHLDVYKRQGIYCILCFQHAGELAGGSNMGIPISLSKHPDL